MPNVAQLPPVALTPWQMVLTADWVVQAVMALLLLASFATWTLLVAKVIELRASRRDLKVALRVVADAPGLPSQLAGYVPRQMVAMAAAETRLSVDLPATGTKDRIALGLRRLEQQASRQLSRGTGLLASIGACAPFIGLFGTVWGIMNSFVGISQAQTTNLAVVAPGIAEALLATATGLAAAIPAVLIYNFLARALGGYRAALGDLSAAILTHASRELDRQQMRVSNGRGRGRPELVHGAAE